MTYAERIDYLVDRCLVNNQGFADRIDLLASLGCRYNLHVCDAPLVPSPEDEPHVRRALLLALRELSAMSTYQERFSVLDGLAKNERWRDCLSTLDDSYSFAKLLLDYTCSDEDTGLCRAVQPGICTMLTAWLKPCSPFTTHPSTHDLARSLFGAWCDFGLPEHDDLGGFDWYIGRAVCSEKPPFKPGLVAIECAENVQLPTLASL